MAAPEKKPADESPPPSPLGQPTKQDRYPAAIKLRETFKDKLTEVAEDLDLYPGQLVEMRMAKWVEVEYKRVIRAKAKRLEGDKPAG